MKEDPKKALLNQRNTTTEGLSVRLCQRMFGRHAQTFVQTSLEALKPCFHQRNLKVQMKIKKVKTAEHSQSYRPLRPLLTGENVQIEPINRHDKEWKEGTVSDHMHKESYKMQLSCCRFLQRT